MCALPKTKVVAGKSAEIKMLNVMQCCPETPILGGKHQNPSKFCIDHINESTDTPIVTPPDFKYFHSLANGEVPLPDNEDNSLLIGCKKTSNLNRFYDRTAGVMALMRPCGIIANFTKMYTCESPTQAYIFIFSTFGHTIDDLDRLKYVGYDRTCDLHPFLVNLSKKRFQRSTSPA